MTDSKIRVVIVDDEPVARRTIRMLLEREPDIVVIGECGNGEDAIEFLTREEVDAVFLDIQMPSSHGFDVLHALPSGASPLVVFVTAHDEYALRAFEVSAIDYVLKPFDDDRFRSTVERVRERVRERRMGGIGQDLRGLADRLASLGGVSTGELDAGSDPATVGAVNGFVTRLVVRRGRKLELVETATIDWIEAEDYCVRLHVGEESHLLRETLTRLEARLDPTEFVRVHRSAIVRIERVKQLVPLEHGDSIVVLHDGTRVRVSRTRRKRVHATLGLR